MEMNLMVCVSTGVNFRECALKVIQVVQATRCNSVVHVAYLVLLLNVWRHGTRRGAFGALVGRREKHLVATGAKWFTLN